MYPMRRCGWPSFRRRLLVSAAGPFLALLACAGAQGASPEAVFGAKGVVASRSPIASEVGAAMLRRGGNAVDAAVATGFALAVTHPSAGNIGGGGFMLIRMADGTLAANDHREKAPAAAFREMFQDEQGNVIEGLSTASHLAVGVPGSVDGLLSVLEKYGTLDRRAVIEPAVRLAREGFALPRDTARSIARRHADFARHPFSAAVFAKADGAPFAAEENFRQPDLAASLERVLEHGRAGFYAGETADLIVAEMQRGGGFITHADLAGYRSVWRQPIRGTYRGHDIVSMPPPSSGGVLLVQMLNMLEAYDIGAMGFGSAAAMHHVIEAERRAYADRAAHLGDADFHPVPVAQLIDKAYARQRFSDFKPQRAAPRHSVQCPARSWSRWRRPAARRPVPGTSPSGRRRRGCPAP